MRVRRNTASGESYGRLQALRAHGEFLKGVAMGDYKKSFGWANINMWGRVQEAPGREGGLTSSYSPEIDCWRPHLFTGSQLHAGELDPACKENGRAST